jgi:hypothetical protein
MRIEEQVCSLELAKRLKELGVKQESAFWWEQVKLAGKNEWAKQYELAFNNRAKPYSDLHIVCAFTVAEFGDVMALHVASYQVEHDDVDANENWEHWCCIQYVPGNHSKYLHVVFANTEANARAKMLVYLLESKTNGLSAGNPAAFVYSC